MKTPSRRAPRIILAAVLALPWSLVLPGCGGNSSPSAPGEVGGLKTPSQVLQEAKEQEKAAKP